MKTYFLIAEYTNFKYFFVNMYHFWMTIGQSGITAIQFQELMPLRLYFYLMFMSKLSNTT